MATPIPWTSSRPDLLAPGVAILAADGDESRMERNTSG